MQRQVLMKLPATALVLLSFGVSAPLSAQDLTITNARIIGPDGSVIERGSIVVRGGKIVSAAAGAPSSTSRQGHRRQRHDGDARLHRRASAHQHRAQREGADAGAARGRLHDHPLGRRASRRQHHARDRIDSGQVNGPRIIPSGAAATESAHARIGARGDPEDGGDGNQVHRRDRADAGSRARPRRRWTFSARSWTKGRRPA